MTTQEAMNTSQQVSEATPSASRRVFGIGELADLITENLSHQDLLRLRQVARCMNPPARSASLSRGGIELPFDELPSETLTNAIDTGVKPVSILVRSSRSAYS